MIGVCRRIAGDAIDDVVQETALQALLGLDRLRRPERFGAWLAGIGLNVARRRRSEPVGWSLDDLVGGRWSPEPIDWRCDPEALAEQHELADEVRQAIEALPRRQRTAVALVYLAGLSQAEAAVQLGIAVGTVKASLFQARRRLRQSLRPHREERVTSTQPEWIRATVFDVRRTIAEPPKTPSHIVLLVEAERERVFPIWIGPSEARVIALILDQVAVPRPMTYSLMANLIAASGATVQAIRISRLFEDTFYAEVQIGGSNGTQIIDARPSDAMALALTTGVPLSVHRSITDRLAPDYQERLDRLNANSVGRAEIVAARRASLT